MPLPVSLGSSVMVAMHLLPALSTVPTSFYSIYFQFSGCVGICVSRCVYVCVQCPWRPEGGAGTNGIEVTGSCELLDMGARNQTQALCKCSAHSQPQRHLLIPSGCSLMKWKRLYFVTDGTNSITRMHQRKGLCVREDGICSLS